jgi:hypothetical protein
MPFVLPPHGLVFHKCMYVTGKNSFLLLASYVHTVSFNLRFLAKQWGLKASLKGPDRWKSSRVRLGLCGGFELLLGIWHGVFLFHTLDMCILACNGVSMLVQLKKMLCSSWYLCTRWLQISNQKCPCGSILHILYGTEVCGGWIHKQNCDWSAVGFPYCWHIPVLKN